MTKKTSPKTKKTKAEIYAGAEGVFKKWLFQERVFADQAMHASTKLVVAELLHQHNLEGDRCNFTTERKLAAKLRMGRKTVHLAIIEAKKVGCLQAFQPARYEKNEYAFNWDWMPSENMDARVKRPRKSSEESKSVRSRIDTSTGIESIPVWPGIDTSTGIESTYQEDIENLSGESDTENKHAQARPTNSHNAAGEQPVVPLPHAAAAGKKSRAARGEITSARDELFARLVAAYPANNGSDRVARTIFLEKLDAGADPEAIIAGAARFKVAQSYQERRYVPWMKTWLAGEQWHDKLPPPPAIPEAISSSKNPGWAAVAASVRQDVLAAYGNAVVEEIDRLKLGST